MSGPKRIQRKRTAGWKMPPNTVYVGRNGAPGPFANPFRVGGYFRMGPGAGHPGFAWLEALKDYADASFTRIESKKQASEWYREYRRLYPLTAEEIARIRGQNLACWCPLDQPCHADVLLEIANAPSPEAHANG